MTEHANMLNDITEQERRKCLGQFPTGLPLARLLAALADARKAKSILDPMAGTGDMVDACLTEGARPDVVGCVEIDPVAHGESCTRFRNKRNSRIVNIRGNAFDPKVLAELPSLEYDLVITNPPYVRYQSQAKENVRVGMPSGREVRSGLLSAIQHSPNLDSVDREAFTKLARYYSGLADLAIPSWILCASLVRHGGRLAMVVPNSWLSRDYATVIQYLLLRWFRIEYIVEDRHAVWFSDALVSTNLIVAERIARLPSVFEGQKEGFLHLSVGKCSGTKNSVVGNLYPRSVHPERKFAQDARRWLSDRELRHDDALDVRWIQLADEAENAKRRFCRTKWLPELEGDISVEMITTGVQLPSQLADCLGSQIRNRLMELETLEVQVGQGLRTGANIFFYVDEVDRRRGKTLVRLSNAFDGDRIEVPSKCLIPVLRRQAELPEGFTLDGCPIRGRVLVLRSFALPEDIAAAGELGEQMLELTKRRLAPMPDELAHYVRRAAQTHVGKKETLIPDLSAVATNVRKASTEPLRPARFWYMLPEFAPRHRPDILLPRVNSGHPVTIMNGRLMLVDANFSSLWLDKNDLVDGPGLLALLNSTWARVAMELTGTVMGGGALKLEATQLRRLPVPRFSNDQWKTLSLLGGKLIGDIKCSMDIRRTIDNVVGLALLGQRYSKTKHSQLCGLGNRLLENRKRR